jgi:hypothetical protein
MRLPIEAQSVIRSMFDRFAPAPLERDTATDKKGDIVWGGDENRRIFTRRVAEQMLYSFPPPAVGAVWGCKKAGGLSSTRPQSKDTLALRYDDGRMLGWDFINGSHGTPQFGESMDLKEGEHTFIRVTPINHLSRTEPSPGPTPTPGPEPTPEPTPMPPPNQAEQLRLLRQDVLRLIENQHILGEVLRTLIEANGELGRTVDTLTSSVGTMANLVSQIPGELRKDRPFEAQVNVFGTRTITGVVKGPQGPPR